MVRSLERRNQFVEFMEFMELMEFVERLEFRGRSTQFGR